MSNQARQFAAINFLLVPGILLFFLAVSCTAPQSTTPEPAGDQRAEAHQRSVDSDRSIWCDLAATRHDFGPILSGGDVKRSHRYHLENRTGHPVHIQKVANRKPCCGQVKAVEPVTLGPGQAIDVDVTLHVGLAAGLVSHLAEIQARGDDDDRLIPVELVTTAVGLARATIDVDDPARLALEPGDSSRVELTIRAFGNRDNPPLPLDDRAVQCDAPVEWVGAEEARTDPDSGLDERRRRLVMTLNASGEPGRRLAFLEVRDSGVTVAQKMLAWEVSPAIKAVPPGLVLSEGAGQTGRFLLQGRDGRAFRVVSARSEVEGLALEPLDDEARAIHVLAVRLEGPPRPEARSGEILVETDHPRQPLVRIAIHVPGQSQGEEISTPKRRLRDEAASVKPGRVHAR